MSPPRLSDVAKAHAATVIESDPPVFNDDAASDDRALYALGYKQEFKR
jgi:hypothetical protein